MEGGREGGISSKLFKCIPFRVNLIVKCIYINCVTDGEPDSESEIEIIFSKYDEKTHTHTESI